MLDHRFVLYEDEQRMVLITAGLLLVAAHRDSTAARPANAHTEETAS